MGESDHPNGVYDGEEDEQCEYAASLSPYLLREVLQPHLESGGGAVVIAGEWHTAAAVLHLAELLRRARIDDRVSFLWNANNTFGFERIAWEDLSRASRVTTVSRYMRQRMWARAVDPLVIPNGLAADAFDPPDSEALAELRARLRDRTVLTKMARWDADKRWLTAIEIVADTKARGWRPLLIARGGIEPYGEEVLAAARARGLRVARRRNEPALPGLLAGLSDVRDIDVVSLESSVAPSGRRVLFRGSAAVLANSAHEPFGLVGLETMAASGVACTGGTGEEYAFPSHNALVLETGRPDEFATLFGLLRAIPAEPLVRPRRATVGPGSSTACCFCESRCCKVVGFVIAGIRARCHLGRRGAERAGHEGPFGSERTTLVSKQERIFAVGEYAAGGVTALVTATATHGVVAPGWDMALAMLVGGFLGIAAHLAIAMVAGPLLGMFPVMASGSLIGSYGGMIFGMRDSMQAASWVRVWIVSALFGLVVVAGVRLYDRALRSRQLAEPVFEDIT